MRKISLLISFALIGSFLWAQGPVDKHGNQIQPEEGDWAIAIDANPFLEYFGNFIGGVDNNSAPTFSFLTVNQTITGKYVVSSDMAYRASLRLGFGSDGLTVMVADRTQSSPPVYPEVPPMVENKMTMSSSNIGLSGGLEFRRGKGRLMGVYGGELGISLGSSKTRYDYGNTLNPTGTPPVGVDPIADDFFTGNITTDTYGNTARITEAKSGTTFGIGARAFIGAEYFIVSKLSIGGEFGWGVVFSTTGTSSVTLESTQGGQTGEQTLEFSKSSFFGVDSENLNTVFGPAGVLRITFYF